MCCDGGCERQRRCELKFRQAEKHGRRCGEAMRAGVHYVHPVHLVHSPPEPVMLEGLIYSRFSVARSQASQRLGHA